MFHIPTIIPARNLVPHRRSHARTALLSRQDHPAHRHSAKRPSQRTQARRSSRKPYLSPAPANVSTPTHLTAYPSPYTRVPRLLVLVSQGRQPTATSLTAPAPSPSQGELAIQHLLKVVRSDACGTRGGSRQRRGPYAARTLSFISGNVPRDRRGRIAHKPDPLSLDEAGSDLEDDALTPRLGLSAGTTAVGSHGVGCGGRQLLESLRSPEPVEARQSVGGWGLGAWVEGVSAREKDDDDDDEPTDTEVLVGAPSSSLLLPTYNSTDSNET